MSKDLNQTNYPQQLYKNLARRHQYYHAHSNFNGCNNCQYKCCSSPMSLDLSISDIFCFSIIIKQSMLETFQQTCQIGIVRDRLLAKAMNLGRWEVKLTVELQSPCPFHIDNLCKAYSHETPYGNIGRPSTCELFPESLWIQTNMKLPKQNHVMLSDYVKYLQGIYPCVTPGNLKPQRLDNLLGLYHIHEQEMLFTEVLLLGRSPCLFDISSLPNWRELNRQYCVQQLFDNDLDVLTHENNVAMSKAEYLIRQSIGKYHPHFINRIHKYLSVDINLPEIYGGFLADI